MKKKYTVAVVGATGAVGKKMLEMLEQTTLPINQVKVLASKRSIGKQCQFNEESLIVEELTVEALKNVDIALFSAGGNISKQFAPEAVKNGTIVIDNTSHFRMDPSVPLVVPEVNKETLKTHQGIIANPNCSTIQMMVALEPIRKIYGLNRVIVSTYQAVSGAGIRAIEELHQQTQAYLNGQSVADLPAETLPCNSDEKHYPIAFNALPQIDVFSDFDYTNEEWKMMNETKKIMQDSTMQVSATFVRIPVISGHSESVYIEVKQAGATVQKLRELLHKAPGVIVQDNPSQQIYPQANTCLNKKATFVGRIRQDRDVKKGFHLWIVADNLLKGAAWNSVQIAETLYEMNLL